MICTASSAVAGRSPTSVAELTSALSEKMQRASGELLPVCRYRKGTQSKGREAMKASEPRHDTKQQAWGVASSGPTAERRRNGMAAAAPLVHESRPPAPLQAKFTDPARAGSVIMTSHSQHSNLQVRYGYQVATYHNSSTVPGAGPGPGTGTGTFGGGHTQVSPLGAWYNTAFMLR